MKILFCSPNQLTKTLGAPKVIVELAEALQEQGWACTMISPADLASNRSEKNGNSLDYSESLRHYLRQHAKRYDVVDYDHEYLPYDRSEFSQQTLFVARSVLLSHHLEVIPIPSAKGLRAMVCRKVKGSSRDEQLQRKIKNATRTMQDADLVNVSNHDDKAELVRRGIQAEKIVVLPFGLSQARRPLFDAVPSAPPEQPFVAFVGTFDYRKGASEFPQVLQSISEAMPTVRFRLLGTKGLFKTQQQVLAHFPRGLRQKLEVTSSFCPEDLPELLRPCSVGIFPSYIEGFPFGVLEMLAASLPVVAYDSPGPPMMLPPEYLVPRGDAKAMSAKVVALLQDSVKLGAARSWAKQQSQQFCWKQVAQLTSKAYLRHLATRR